MEVSKVLVIRLFMLKTFIFIKRGSYWKTPHWSFVTFFQTIVSAMHTQIPMAWEGQRVMYIFWLWFNFIINNSFITVFVAQLLPSKEAEQFRTVMDLIEANTTLFTEIGHFQFYQSSLRRFELNQFYGKPEVIAGNSALLTSRLTRMKLLKMFPSEFYFVPECLTTFSGPLISPSSIIFQKTITVTSRIQAAGLFKFWLHNHLTNVFPVRDNVQPHLDIVNPLKLSEIVYFMKYWAFGVVLAICVFVSEVLFKNRKCK